MARLANAPPKAASAQSGSTEWIVELPTRKESNCAAADELLGEEAPVLQRITGFGRDESDGRDAERIDQQDQQQVVSAERRRVGDRKSPQKALPHGQRPSELEIDEALRLARADLEHHHDGSKREGGAVGGERLEPVLDEFLGARADDRDRGGDRQHRRPFGLPLQGR